MKKKNVVKENRDFSNLITGGKKYWNDTFSIYYGNNNCNNYRFGISVSKKIGNAVIRNKIKRQIRSIIDKHKNIYQNEKDYIIIVRKNYINLNFSEIEMKFLELMKKITHKGE
jgi:ribonuclease P protein component